MWSTLSAHDRGRGVRLIAGADEVGRACWAGPIMAAGVLFDLERLASGAGSELLEELDDSKRLSDAKLERLARDVLDHAEPVSLVSVPASQIDRIGINPANVACLERALRGVGERAELRLVDGRLPLGADAPVHELIVHGDATSATVAAASMVAKAARDRLMARLGDRYPGYGFEVHHGYGTEAHRDALARLGPSPEHRLGFNLRDREAVAVAPARPRKPRRPSWRDLPPTELAAHLLATPTIGDRLWTDEPRLPPSPGQRSFAASCSTRRPRVKTRSPYSRAWLNPGVRRLVPAALGFLALAVPALAATKTQHVSLGVLGDPGRFQQQTGQVTESRLRIVGWGQGATYGSPFADLLATMGTQPMLGLSTGLQHGGEITPKQIASGQGDAYLVAVNHAIHAFGKPLFFRPYAEMNGHWNPYCAYNTNGTPRNSSHTTAMFRAAFARTYLLAHGGPKVNGVLKALGQPAVRGSLFANSNVQVIWNPQGAGSPDLAGNSAAAYYPGDSYVDVVGDDLYDIRFNPDWKDAEALYSAHPSKPYSFPEWAPWGIDDPGFVSKMATFVKTHSRTILISYYSGTPGSVFDLETKPKSRSVYRSQIVPLGR